MKNLYLIISAVLIFSMLVIPLLATLPAAAQKPQQNITEPLKSSDKIRLKNNETGEVGEITVADYLYGAVSAEMPALYSDEALKAQAVAAYTYFLFKKAQNTDKDYDITDTYTIDQAYLTDDALKEKWGENYAEYSQKIKNAVNAVAGMALTYDGEVILAVYHAISSGKTETAGDVWGKDYPYLTRVESIGDLLCPDYLSTVTVTADEFCSALTDKVSFSGNAESWIGEIVNTESSAVKQITVCNTALSGTDIRNAFSLRSCSFDVEFKDNCFTFTVRGYGHGVGLSQYGANYMALQGSSYMEILSWYYPGCLLEKR